MSAEKDYDLFNRRGQLRRGETERLARRAADAHGFVMAEGDWLQTASGLVISGAPTPAQPRKLLIEITSGTDPYAWTEQDYEEDEHEDKVGGLSGTVSEFPAFELNGNTAVAAGTVVEATVDPSGEFVTFTHEAGGGSAVADSDTAGIVSLADQVLGDGRKTFQDAVFIRPDGSADGDGFVGDGTRLRTIVSGGLTYFELAGYVGASFLGPSFIFDHGVAGLGEQIIVGGLFGYLYRIPRWTVDAAGAVEAPASSTDTGTPGDVAFDASWLYVCIATDTWKRVAIATF